MTLCDKTCITWISQGPRFTVQLWFFSAKLFEPTFGSTWKTSGIRHRVRSLVHLTDKQVVTDHMLNYKGATSILELIVQPQTHASLYTLMSGFEPRHQAYWICRVPHTRTLSFIPPYVEMNGGYNYLFMRLYFILIKGAASFRTVNEISER